MRAVVIHAPHELRVERRDDPGAPGAGAVAVRIGRGGICGSDLHYAQHGGFGTVRVRAPMILGHEIAGTVIATGPGVDGLAPGDVVAVNPSRPCGNCAFCRDGRPNQCLDMRFLGSAMRDPHVDGGFRDVLHCPAEAAVRLPAGTDPAVAAFAEPLAVCLHAARRAGDLLGRRVLITGAGPIGALLALLARRAGASFVAVTDLVAAPLATLSRIGAADRTVAVGGADPDHDDALGDWSAGRGFFDVAFEASGSAAALATAIETARPGATVVQVGLFGALPAVPMNVVIGREIALRGTFRFTDEFAAAAHLLAAGRIDPMPLLSGTVPVADAGAAFALAADRARAIKVQLDFG